MHQSRLDYVYDGSSLRARLPGLPLRHPIDSARSHLRMASVLVADVPLARTERPHWMTRLFGE